MRLKLPFKLKDLTTNRGIATIYLVMMCTQFVAIEGYGVSNVKVALMALAPLLLIFKVPYMTKATVWCSLYMVVVLFCAYRQDYVRFSTLGYLGMFLITYIVFYNLLYKKHAFSLLYFIRLLRIMILAYAICLLAQQAFILIGIRNFPLINLYNQYFLAINRLPVWNLEPSHVARVLGVLYYAYLKCCEIVEEEKLSLKRVFELPHRWITIGFLYTMVTMGSGTAFISLMILAMYFLKTKALWYVVPIFIGLYFTLPLMNIKQLDRAVNVINATLTLNSEEVKRADGSAASRVSLVFNTLNMDLSKSETWFGKGTNTREENIHMHRAQKSKMGNIDQYGLLSYIVSLILMFNCAMHFMSLPTLMSFAGVGGGIVNIAYPWGILMIFTAVRYFSENKERYFFSVLK